MAFWKSPEGSREVVNRNGVPGFGEIYEIFWEAKPEAEWGSGEGGGVEVEDDGDVVGGDALALSDVVVLRRTQDY